MLSQAKTDENLNIYQYKFFKCNEQVHVSSLNNSFMCKSAQKLLATTLTRATIIINYHKTFKYLNHLVEYILSKKNSKYFFTDS